MKSHTRIFLFTILNTRRSKFQNMQKFNSVNRIYLIFNKANGYFEKISGNKYLTLVPTNESKEKIKKYEELWSKIRYLISSVTKKSDEYDEKYMKSDLIQKTRYL